MQVLPYVYHVSTIIVDTGIIVSAITAYISIQHKNETELTIV